MCNIWCCFKNNCFWKICQLQFSTHFYICIVVNPLIERYFLHLLSYVINNKLKYPKTSSSGNSARASQKFVNGEYTAPKTMILKLIVQVCNSDVVSKITVFRNFSNCTFKILSNFSTQVLYCIAFVLLSIT